MEKNLRSNNVMVLVSIRNLKTVLWLTHAAAKIYISDFPPNCSSYKGAHEPECYSSIWKLVGCRDDGLAAPHRLSPQGLKLLDRLNLK